MSRDALLHDCAVHFQVCFFGPSDVTVPSYSVHGIHWVVSLISELGVQQGTLGSLVFFALFLHKIVQSIDAGDDCLNIVFQAWYLDHGVLADKKSASVLSALTLIQEIGPTLGLHVNIAKCELYWKSNTTAFLSELRYQTSHILTS